VLCVGRDTLHTVIHVYISFTLCYIYHICTCVYQLYAVIYIIYVHVCCSAISRARHITHGYACIYRLHTATHCNKTNCNTLQQTATNCNTLQHTTAHDTLHRTASWDTQQPITGWRRPIGCLELQVIFRKRATDYSALLQEMTYENNGTLGNTLQGGVE